MVSYNGARNRRICPSIRSAVADQRGPLRANMPVLVLVGATALRAVAV